MLQKRPARVDPNLADPFISLGRSDTTNGNLFNTSVSSTTPVTFDVPSRPSRQALIEKSANKRIEKKPSVVDQVKSSSLPSIAYLPSPPVTPPSRRDELREEEDSEMRTRARIRDIPSVPQELPVLDEEEEVPVPNPAMSNIEQGSLVSQSPIYPEFSQSFIRWITLHKFPTPRRTFKYCNLKFFGMYI
jgi:hypothetical protein